MIVPNQKHLKNLKFQDLIQANMLEKIKRNLILKNFSK